MTLLVEGSVVGKPSLPSKEVQLAFDEVGASPDSTAQAFNRMMTSFEMKNPIDLSIDPSRGTTSEPAAGVMSPTNDARFSRITGVRGANGGGTGGDFSNFCDDSKIMDLLINNTDDLDANGEQRVLFEELDMGQIDEEERQFLLIDKDTGRVYDLRNED
jgi:hypothetical protein